MAKVIQIRNVPEGLHRQLKSRAGIAGMSLSDYLLTEIRDFAARPTLEEMRERLRQTSTGKRSDAGSPLNPNRSTRHMFSISKCSKYCGASCGSARSRLFE